MGTVKSLAEEVERGLRQIHPKLRKTVVGLNTYQFVYSYEIKVLQ